jgi:hypothetical protein
MIPLVRPDSQQSQKIYYANSMATLAAL